MTEANKITYRNGIVQPLARCLHLSLQIHDRIVTLGMNGIDDAMDKSRSRRHSASVDGHFRCGFYSALLEIYLDGNVDLSYS